MGNKENVSTLMTRLGCFQSFVKRVVKRLWVTFIIKIVSLFRTIPPIGVCDKRFPQLRDYRKGNGLIDKANFVMNDPLT
jgi:hypothetical protein